MNSVHQNAMNCTAPRRKEVDAVMLGILEGSAECPDIPKRLRSKLQRDLLNIAWHASAPDALILRSEGIRLVRKWRRTKNLIWPRLLGKLAALLTWRVTRAGDGQ